MKRGAHRNSNTYICKFNLKVVGECAVDGIEFIYPTQWYRWITSHVTYYRIE